MTFSEAERETLLDLAREAIRHGLDTGRPLAPSAGDYPGRLRAELASFVTLRRRGALRGCIGGLTARFPLVTDVARHAHGAAFEDPRFPRLEWREYEALAVQISVLGPPAPLAYESEAALVAELVPGVDGLVIEDGERRATFLPAVWASLPQPDRFLAELKRKAGIPGNRTPRHAYRYSTVTFGDEHAGKGLA